MLRRIVNIPEGVYYRGRFRATVAWSKVSGSDGEDIAVIHGEKRTRAAGEADKALRERGMPGKTRIPALHVAPAELSRL